MSENNRPELGTTEAAVLTVVELIARAAQMSEAHMAYWLDLYYQVRSRHEAESAVQAETVPEPVEEAAGSKKKTDPPEL